MPVFRKTRQSKNIPSATHLKPSTSSRLNMNMFGSATSMSSILEASQSTKSLFISSLRGLVHGKENSTPSSVSQSPETLSSYDSPPTITYPDISAPILTPESLSAVKERYRLIPLSAAAADENLTSISRGSESSASQDTDTSSIQNDRRSETHTIKRVGVPPIIALSIDTSDQNFAHSVLQKI